jgi:hypothetical protein
MRPVGNIQFAFLSCVAILAASAWPGPAMACRIPAVMTTEMPNATEIIPHQHARQVTPTREPPGTSRATPVVKAGGQRLDCRACIGMMPALNSQDLMPLVPFADQALRIHPVDLSANQTGRGRQDSHSSGDAAR